MQRATVRLVVDHVCDCVDAPGPAAPARSASIALLGSSSRRVKVGIAAPPELSLGRKDR